MNDPAIKPAHYTAGRTLEPFDVIDDWRLGYYLGAAIAYIARAGRKDGASADQDLEKAVAHIQREIKNIRGKQ